MLNQMDHLKSMVETVGKSLKTHSNFFGDFMKILLDKLIFLRDSSNALFLRFDDA